MITAIACGDHVNIVLNLDESFAGTVFLYSSMLPVPQDARALSKNYIRDLT